MRLQRHLYSTASISFIFARVFGPTLPYPATPAFAIPYFTWNFCSARSVSTPKRLVSLPGAPAPLCAMRVALSVLRIRWTVRTSSATLPTRIVRVSLAAVIRGDGAGAADGSLTATPASTLHKLGSCPPSSLNIEMPRTPSRLARAILSAVDCASGQSSRRYERLELFCVAYALAVAAARFPSTSCENGAVEVGRFVK